MSRIILREEALSSIVENALLKIEGVRGLSLRSPVRFEYSNAEIFIEVRIQAFFNVDLVKVGREVIEKIKLEVESITPFKVKDIKVIFEDVVYES